MSDIPRTKDGGLLGRTLVDEVNRGVASHVSVMVYNKATKVTSPVVDIAFGMGTVAFVVEGSEEEKAAAKMDDSL